MNPYLTITGDVHNKIDRYVEKIQSSNTQHSIQVGDMGFDYLGLNALDPNNHKFIGGNHDNYDVYSSSPHALGHYGNAFVGDLKYFYVRGAASIDVLTRKRLMDMGHRKCWWEEEEISYHSMCKAYDLYRLSKPTTMITHTCPTEVAKIIGNPSILRNFGFNPDTYSEPTQIFLQDCLDFHAPELWIFGHFHTSKKFVHKGTLFICLDELESIVFDKDGYNPSIQGYRFGHE